MLGQIDGEGKVVLADFEAGVGTLSRLKPERLDVLVVVAEPTVKSLEVARRAAALAGERGLSLRVVANRVAGEEDRRRVEEALPGGDLTVVPEDEAIRAADLRGQAPFDAAPEAPAVRALRDLAGSLLG